MSRCPVCDAKLSINVNTITNYYESCTICDYSYVYVNDRYEIIVQGQTFNWGYHNLYKQSELAARAIEHARMALYAV
jgi:hypothetical protein